MVERSSRRRWPSPPPSAARTRGGRLLLAWCVLAAASRPTEVRAHLLDELAETLLCDLQLHDDRHLRATWYVEAERVEAYFDAAAQIGQAPARTAAVFAQRLAEGFVVDGCRAQPAAPAEVAAPDRTGYRGFAVDLSCQAPLRTLRLQRVDYNRDKTRATLYLALRMPGQAPRRLLLPPRLAALEVALDAGGAARPVAAATEVRDAVARPLLPSDDVAVDELPPPGARAAWWQRRPPWPLLRAWAEAGAGHMVGGLDHLLFLAALALVARSWAGLAAGVAAFSLGHMATMAAAIAGAWPPLPPVEVAIGLTIAVAAAVGWRSAAAAAPRSLALGCLAAGLVHGAAFGAELRSAIGSSDGLLWPVLAFGVGLDAVQTVAAAGVYGLHVAARPKPWAVAAHRAALAVLGLAGCGYALRAAIPA